jgi:hypothetical protein
MYLLQRNVTPYRWQQFFKRKTQKEQGSKFWVTRPAHQNGQDGFVGRIKREKTWKRQGLFSHL